MQRLDLAAIDRLRTAIADFIRTLAGLVATIVQYAIQRPRRKAALAAENLFLRKQLALYQERGIKSRRADNATRASLVWLMKYFSWRDTLVIVSPSTLIRWHREGFRLFWRLQSRPGRPAVPTDVQRLIRRMALGLEPPDNQCRHRVIFVDSVKQRRLHVSQLCLSRCRVFLTLPTSCPRFLTW